MTDPEVRYLGDVQRLALKPGDTIVLQSDQEISDETAVRLRNYVEQFLPGHKVLVLGDGLKIGVLVAED